jgi:serpin B
MKHHSLGLARRTALVGSLSGILLAACSRRQTQATDSPVEPWNPSAAAQQFSKAVRAFGGQVLDALCRETPKNTVIFSPLSITTVLTMLAEGARGATSTQLAQALGFTAVELTLPAAAAGYAEIHQHLKPSSAATVASANGLWADRRANLNAEFARGQAKLFSSRIESLDFTDPTMPSAINGFVSEATRGKIPRVIDRAPTGGGLVLVSTLYFKGGWDKTFDASQTRAESFKCADGRVVQAPMMRQHGGFSYFESRAIQSVCLPYADPRFELVLGLLKPGGRPKDWISALDNDRHFAHRRGDVIIPRLNLSWARGIKATLAGLGLGDALGASPDYSGLASSPVAVSELIHKTVLLVDEQGAEAAAVSAVEEATTAAPRREAPHKPFTFRADRPFFLALREVDTGAPLFMAYISAPRDEV